MKVRQASVVILLWLALLLPAGADLGILPPLDPDPRQLEHLQRTMALLNTSTPQHRNTVRVLFYGQSITKQEWWYQVAQSILDRYPSVDLVVENRAINGHPVNQLLRTAQADVYPFQPDLIIFHAFGSEDAHEQFQHDIHLRTCAEVMWQNDHVTGWESEPEAQPTPVSELSPTNRNWHSLVFLPQTAARYADCLVDVRTPWDAYLRTNQVSLTNLLKDQVHLNAAGRQLLADIVLPYLAPRDGTVPLDPYNCLGVHTYRVGDQIHWLNGALAVPVRGSRIDVILGPGKDMSIKAEIDGQPPTTFPGNWAFTRTTEFGEGGYPSLLRVDSAARLQAEHWQLTVTGTSGDTFTFALHGSVTGDDGVGTNTSEFRSNSGRVVLHPDDWSLQYPPVGFEVAWDAVPLGQDNFYARLPEDGPIETVLTLAQNLPDAFHLLVLKAAESGTPAIRAIRVYSPAERFNATYQPPALRLAFGLDGAPWLEWPAWSPSWVPERATSLDPAAPWTPIWDEPVLVQQKLALEVPGEGPVNLYRLHFSGGIEGL